jgi:hypothetical protein
VIIHYYTTAILMGVLKVPTNPGQAMKTEAAATFVMKSIFNHTTLLLGGYTISTTFSRCQLDLCMAAFMQKRFGNFQVDQQPHCAEPLRNDQPPRRARPAYGLQVCHMVHGLGNFALSILTPRIFSSSALFLGSRRRCCWGSRMRATTAA